MEEAFFDAPLFCEFAQLDEFSRLPDETTILRFLHRLEKHTRAELILITVNELLTERGYACARKRGKCPAKALNGRKNIQISGDRA
jgi:IS5 family transposase